MKLAIVTGSNGLIGSQTVKFLIERGYRVYGIDNDMRSYFFGSDASTKDSEKSMLAEYGDLYHVSNIDIRDFNQIDILFSRIVNEGELDLIVHTAAQPSHDWAAKEPLTDFSVNAIGTVNMLELTRLYAPKATFIFTSTNKVYGDTPNRLNIVEQPSRYEAFIEINEKMSIDQTKHSIFGASKVAADVMVQEYGRYFGMNTVVFRGGCLTGPNHAGSELHGFLSYLIKCIVNNKPYTIFGYKGKQVRDNIHSWDLVNMFWHYHKNPKPGSVYNAGGGRDNSTSIIEAIQTANKILKDIFPDHIDWEKYTIEEENRIGDHIWWITDLSKFKNDYPEWPGVTISLEETIRQIILAELEKINKNYGKI